MTIVSQYLFSPSVVIEALNLAGHLSFQNKGYIFHLLCNCTWSYDLVPVNGMCVGMTCASLCHALPAFPLLPPPCCLYCRHEVNCPGPCMKGSHPREGGATREEAPESLTSIPACVPAQGH